MAKPRCDAARRRFLTAAGIGGSTVMAGCLGDDGVDDVGDEPEADDADTADDSVEEPSEEQIPDVHDAVLAWANHHYSDLPGDSQYNPYASQPSPPGDFPFRSPHVIGRSMIDYGHHGHIAADWSYEPGVLEFSFHDDFYWWSGDQVTVDDLLTQLEYEDYLWGGDDLDAFENIVARDRIDDDTVRMTLTDSWHEDWAISQSVENHIINASQTLLEPWVEEFDDAPDLDAVEELREVNTDEHVIDTDEELVHVYMSPFEFRLDGSIGEVGEDYWELELVQEKDGNLRHHANYDHHEPLPNYARARYEVHEDPAVVAMERFQSQEQPFATWATDAPLNAALEGEFEFEINFIEFFRPPSLDGGIQFNHEVHPTSSANFRRAFGFLIDNTAWEDYRANRPAERNHPFFEDRELEMFVSEEVIEAFTDYTYDAMDVDAAIEELTAGGFEQDADGNWLMQEDGPGGDAGAPMEFEFGTHSWLDALHDHGSDWLADMDEFGISLEAMIELPEQWTVLYTYTGGGTPEHALANIYLNADWARPDYNISSVVLAPPLLETPPIGADPDEWVEYEVEAMTQRLTVTTDEAMHQQMVDELVWVVNQTCNHFTTAPSPRLVAANQERWHWPERDDVANRWTEVAFRIPHYGVMEYRS